MNRRAPQALLTLALAWFVGQPAISQVLMQPTPLPTVTAENESWYLNGDPITYAGNLYYPAGPAVFFNPNEMVRSGFYQGIPLYARTTIEPYSIVYAPLAGGRMQPYERPRSGELAGTAGSTPSLLPTPPQTGAPRGFIAQAAGPPSQTARVIPVHVPEPVETGIAPPHDARAEGTAGRAASPRRPGRRSGTNSIFIEFQNTRWYPAGAAERIDTSRMVLIDDYKGFGIFAPGADSDIVYVPVTRAGTLAAPYARTRK